MRRATRLSTVYVSWFVALLLLLEILPACDEMADLPDTSDTPTPPAPHPAPPDPPAEDGCPPGSMRGWDAVCQPAGLPVVGPACPAGWFEQQGICKEAGVDPEVCLASGFEPDGMRGCAATTPFCGKGEVALPGDTTCRAVLCPISIAVVPPGAVPVAFVQEGFAGIPDGSMESPWPTIQQAIDALPPGGRVIVGPGSYAENVRVKKPLALEGSCTGSSRIVGAAVALTIEDTSDVTVRNMEITAPTATGQGVRVVGSKDVVLDALWVHDIGKGCTELWCSGLELRDSDNVRVSRSLVEDATGVGIISVTTSTEIVDTVVRSTGVNIKGAAANLLVNDGAASNKTTVVTHSVLETSDLAGVVVQRDTAVTMVGSLIRGPSGAGVLVFKGGIFDAARSVVDGVSGYGIFATSISSFGSNQVDPTAHVLLEDVTVVGTKGHAYNHLEGSAIYVDRALLDLVSSTVVDTEGGAIDVRQQSLATLTGVVARDTNPAFRGRGLNVMGGSQVTAIGSLMERMNDVGIASFASNIDIAQCIVSETQPAPEYAAAGGLRLGHGLYAGVGTLPQRASAHGWSRKPEQVPSIMKVAWSIVANNASSGIAVEDSHAEVFASSILYNGRPFPRAKLGRGIVAVFLGWRRPQDTVEVTASVIEGNDIFNAGVSGPGELSIRGTLVSGGLFHGDQRAPIGVGAEAAARLVVEGSRVVESSQVGVYVHEAQADIHGIIVERTAIDSELGQGEGVAVLADLALREQLPPLDQAGAHARVATSLIEKNGRSGIVVVGATLDLTDVKLRCNPVDLQVLQTDVNGEESSAALDASGGFECTCGNDTQCHLDAGEFDPPTISVDPISFVPIELPPQPPA